MIRDAVLPVDLGKGLLPTAINPLTDLLLKTARGYV